MLTLHRNESRFDVEASAWAEMLNFLQKCGWTASVPTYYWLADGVTVSEADAISLSQAGNVVLEETLNDPISAYSTIKFDIATFSAIIAFASEGEFSITHSP